MGGAELELFLKFFFLIVVISTIIFWGVYPWLELKSIISWDINSVSVATTGH